LYGEAEEEALCAAVECVVGVGNCSHLLVHTCLQGAHAHLCFTGAVVFRVVVCGFVLVVLCVVLLWCCSCRVVWCVVFVVCLCVTCFSSTGARVVR